MVVIYLEVISNKYTSTRGILKYSLLQFGVVHPYDGSFIHFPILEDLSQDTDKRVLLLPLLCPQ